MTRTPIHLRRLAASTALAATLGLSALVAPAVASATTPGPTLPQASSAQAAAGWLASQINSDGYIPSTTTPGTADIDSTANAVLALASAGVDTATADSARSAFSRPTSTPTSPCRVATDRASSPS